MKAIRILLFLTILFPFAKSHGEDIDYYGKKTVAGKFIEIYEDESNKKTLSELDSSQFVRSYAETPNFGLSKSAFWIKLKIKNHTKEENILLELASPMIDLCQLYSGETSKLLQSNSENLPFRLRKVNDPNLVFELKVPPGQAKTFFLKVLASEQLILPLIINSPKDFYHDSLIKEILAGIQIGILLVMILYNLFIYFSVKEQSYLYYVLYILFIGLTQLTLTGYTYKYLWPDTPAFNNLAYVMFPALAGIFTILFIKNFLHTSVKSPILHHMLTIVSFGYGLALVTRVLGFDLISFRIIDIMALTGAIVTLIIAARLSFFENYRPAKFFLTAWLVFLVGLILYIIRNLNMLPYNDFTNYSMQVGTIIEVILLSFALADKINILKKERELSQEQALRISLENEKIIREQNISLEKKVAERTIELTQTNLDLEDTLNKLKDAQSQLIESEKMASLGQLTAGIAHEINNPINFVSSNIRPLRRDIDDVMEILSEFDEMQQIDSIEGIHTKLNQIDKLKKDLDLDYIKTEIGLLLTGMEDGARRTVEIVKGLKVFSRVDESDLNFVNLNEGIESTLVILNYQMGTNLELVKNLGSIPNVECYGGKMNQVFMNILTNSIYAVQKGNLTDRKPTIWVKTFLKDSEHVVISIKDNGSGMSPEVKAKIYDPFFTTKDVGEGTGLGLSIVFKIIEVHYGTIEVISEVDQGTEFVITLPITKKNSLT
ncbi:7TM diverse intracellular signaling domain-containing protein [Dyadobacter subterraneus]|uniref:histidine kinase n=1 Tax=Dyadobacter subterraneus TaxID=2773304 RepID=A0ABR9W726_9BACT|nr:7TM diverse intracellular signaling domain-containing protein [Dyadobacter subterraneus]MBE9461258.1 GHKL domain-containing protein [Dyadobacter subterraneus]